MSGDFSPADVERIARLARLSLTADERTRLARQLSGILEYARQIQAIDTAPTGVPTDAAAGLTLREDRVTPSLDRDEVLASAPEADREAGLFKVPRVIG